MALALFAGIIILFLQLFIVTEDIISNLYLRRIAGIVFGTARLYVPAIIFTHTQKVAGAEPIKISSMEGFSVKNKITLSFAAFAFIFAFGLLYSAAFPSAASTFSDNDIFSLILTLIGSVLVPALFEELLYRKILCAELTLHGRVFASIISALLFGLAHFSFYTFPYAFICGLVLAFVYLKTGSVRYTVVIHFANNLFGYICAYISTKMTPLDYGNAIMLLVIALGVLSVGAFCTLFPDMKKEPFEDVRLGAPSSVFLSFPMIVYIICAALMNFI